MRRRVASAAERGTASLEFLALAPMVMVVAFMTWQLAVGGWAAVSANEAARAAARAATVGQSPDAAAQDSLPAGLKDHTLTGGRSGDGYTYTVSVAVPAFTVLGLDPVERTVSMPAENP
ncbi:TadE/TadG family type IV pilus assembly protein [Phycicoccus flavus]|uniref:TadE/TadG family type IV pilus assembly protein n=1 Tax=Phycicoccus flavus TaxID=2502783 RepID=UPI000FEBC0D9|nr:TadE/TadG family type IV pilus assembly protein [Phycicoccus flavus]NHA69462.1 hypothetical protein [Phycicoccus flavus]